MIPHIIHSKAFITHDYCLSDIFENIYKSIERGWKMNVKICEHMENSKYMKEIIGWEKFTFNYRGAFIAYFIILNIGGEW